MVKCFDVVNKAEADVSLELSCFFHDPADVDNLISRSSAFSKSSLNIRKFMVHVLLKPGLENFEHYFASVWDERNCVVVWTFFGSGMKTNLFQSCSHCWVFQICWHIKCSTLTASSFRIWNSLVGIPSPPVALFTVMLPKAHWLWIPGCLALGEWSHHCGYLGHKDLFCIVLCILASSSIYLLLLCGPYHFCPLLCPSLQEMFPWYFKFYWGDL